MSQDQVEAASKKLFDEHQKKLQETNRQRLEEFRARRLAALRIATAVWLLPPAALYALGWSAGWVRRGFQQTNAK